jgi:hypothetical protein
VETTLPAPPADQLWVPLATSGAVYLSNGTPRIVALSDEAEDDATLRREIEMLTGCSVVVEARVAIAANALGFTHAALLVPSRGRGARKRRSVRPTLNRRAWR